MSNDDRRYACVLEAVGLGTDSKCVLVWIKVIIAEWKDSTVCNSTALNGIQSVNNVWHC